MSIADRIKTSRLQLGWTQARLAEEMGISTQAVSQWETGRTEPQGPRAMALADALNVKFSWLMIGGDEQDWRVAGRTSQMIQLLSSFDLIRYSLLPYGSDFDPDDDNPLVTTTFPFKGKGFAYETDGAELVGFDKGEILLFDTGVDDAGIGDIICAAVMDGRRWEIVIGAYEPGQQVGGRPVIASMREKMRGEALRDALSGERPAGTYIATLVERRIFYRS